MLSGPKRSPFWGWGWEGDLLRDGKLEQPASTSSASLLCVSGPAAIPAATWPPLPFLQPPLHPRQLEGSRPATGQLAGIAGAVNFSPFGPFTFLTAGHLLPSEDNRQ